MSYICTYMAYQHAPIRSSAEFAKHVHCTQQGCMHVYIIHIIYLHALVGGGTCGQCKPSCLRGLLIRVAPFKYQEQPYMYTYIYIYMKPARGPQNRVFLAIIVMESQGLPTMKCQAKCAKAPIGFCTYLLYFNLFQFGPDAQANLGNKASTNHGPVACAFLRGFEQRRNLSATHLHEDSPRQRSGMVLQAYCTPPNAPSGIH